MVGALTTMAASAVNVLPAINWMNLEEIVKVSMIKINHDSIIDTLLTIFHI